MLFTPRVLPSSSIPTFIVFSIVCVAASSSDDLCSSLPRPLSCDCSNTPDGYELRCSAFTMQVKPKAVVRIQCDTNAFSGFSELNGTRVGEMGTLIIRLCPLHSMTLSQVMKKIGVSNVSNVQLTYTEVNRNSATTVRREQFRGLSNVTSLTLHTNGTTELMDDVFADMPNLTFIDLESDNLVLPKNIFCSIEKLQVLRLVGNNLTYLEPEIFRNLIHLRILVLWGNMDNLSRAVFSKMSNLELIDINSAKMTSLPSDLLVDLTKLQNINLHANELISPAQQFLISNLGLETVNIQDNWRSLNTAPPKMFADLTKLRIVTIRNSNMSTLPGDLLRGSASIHTISLNNNAFVTLPETLFEDCKKLETVDISYNMIKDLPDRLFSGMTKLKSLKINNNQLSVIANQLFSSLSSLVVLDLMDNRLTHVQSQAFENLSSLKTVNMSNNMLTFEDTSKGFLSPLKSCRMLENIQLANNSVTRIFGDWRNLNNLETLNLAYNKISQITYADLGFLSGKDVSVNVSYNNISEIDVFYYGVYFGEKWGTFRLFKYPLITTSLQKNRHFVYRYIFAEGNLFKCGCKVPSFLLRHQTRTTIFKVIVETEHKNVHCIKAEEYSELLDTSFFSIKIVSCLLEKRQILNCPEQCRCPLMISDRALLVDCSQRKLTSMITPEDMLHILPRSNFSETHNLNFLEIDSIKIHSLPSELLLNLTQLYSINLHGNEFLSVPQNLFVNNRKLRGVYIVDNRRTLSTLPPGLLRNLTTLIEVTLRSCNMSTLPEDLLWGSRNIQYIVLNRNAFTTLPEQLFKDCSSLYTLDLSYNKITNLPIQLFNGCKELHTLKINSNELSIIPNNLFSSLENLQVLDLKDNRLRHIESEAFFRFKSLRILDMSNNLLTFRDTLETSAHSPLKIRDTLVDLQLSNNSVTRIFPDWRQFRRLKTLNLSFNKITKIKAEDLHFNSEGETFVNISYNNISVMEIFENNRIYKYVSESVVYNIPKRHYFIEGNPISCACKVYRFLKYNNEDITAEIIITTETNTSSLQCVGLEAYTGQVISKIPTRPFTCLRRTEYRSNCAEKCSCLLFPETKTMVVECVQTNLTLTPARENVLHNLSKYVFSKLHTLESLDIKWNRMTRLPSDLFVELVNLRKLNMYACRVESLPQDLFVNNKDLEIINFENNGVELNSVAPRLLAGLTKLKEVKLISCNIRNIPEDLFLGSTSINTISLKNNALITLPEKLFIDCSELMTLDISFNRITDLPSHLFFTTRNLKTLKINNNQLSSIGNYLIYLTKLEILDVKCNSLTEINYVPLRHLSSLKAVDMSNNMLTSENQWPVYFNKDNDEDILYSMDVVAPNLVDIQLANNSLTSIFFAWHRMKNLQTLNLAYNKFSHLQFQYLHFYQRNNIFVNLSYNNISEIVMFTQDHALNLKYVPLTRVYTHNMPERHFYIEGNPIECGCKSYSFLEEYFDEDIATVTLTIGSEPHNLWCNNPEERDNNIWERAITKTVQQYTEQLNDSIPLKYFTCLYRNGYNLNCPETCSCLFRTYDKALRVDCQQRNLTSMPAALPDIMFSKYTELDLSRNRIKSVKDLLGQGYNKVTKYILSDNMINEIDLTTFHPQLEVLELDVNSINQFNKSSIEFLMNSKFLTHLSLHKNPWRCDCTTKEFMNAMQKFYRLGKIDNFTCENGKEIMKISVTELCPVEPKIIINENYTNVVLGLFGLLIGCLLALYYKFKIAIKIWLYAHRCCLCCVNEEELDKDKLYDAFVSYAHQDEEYVLDNLVPRLEDDQYTLCLHQRDWIPGEFIQAQIIKSVEASRRTLIVLSRAFLDSMWGIMEFRVAHQQALRDGRVRVIIILYGDIEPIDKLDSELRSYITMNTYVKWDDKWFWDKIRYAMPHSTKLRTEIPLQERT